MLNKFLRACSNIKYNIFNRKQLNEINENINKLNSYLQKEKWNTYIYDNLNKRLNLLNNLKEIPYHLKDAIYKTIANIKKFKNTQQNPNNHLIPPLPTIQEVSAEEVPEED